MRRSPFVPWAWSGQRRVGQRAQLVLSTVMKRPRGNTIPAVCCYTVLLLEIITHHWDVYVCVYGAGVGEVWSITAQRLLQGTE